MRDLVGSILVFGFTLLIVIPIIRSCSNLFSGPPYGNYKRENSREEELLREELKSDIEGDNWKLSRIYDSEVVEDYEGGYFLLEVQDATANAVLYFQIGEYVIENFESKYGDAVADFMDEVLDVLIAGETEFEIFVLGSADQDRLENGEFKKNLDPRYSSREFRIINFFEKNDSRGTRFHSKIKKRYVNNVFTNDDLPNLRAAFVKHELEKIYRMIKTPIILEGNVDRGQVKPEKRNVTLMLFIAKDFLNPELKN